ncbi:MAG: carboxypeptidase-like regulatory domain-containing protein, partial [Acidobacteriota bacterium]|nr:carboxypeptidase-like regulatory domain-containing protein [Acidobacteriota bacterium]
MIPSHRLRSVVFCACLLTLLALPASTFAQQVYGNIIGTVTDAQGAGVPQAKVTITDQNKNTKSEVTTNETGNYTKGQLIPGTYTVEVESAGFRKAVSKDILVNVDATARVDVALEIGNVSESVEVTAAAPLLQSDRADVATTFSSQQLVNLPSFNRNFQAYELLTPGTIRTNWQHASSENPQGSVQILVNGQHFSGTGFQLDGTENQSPILG